MPLGLSEYIADLDERSDLLWPAPPPPAPLKATPALQPLAGIRVVTFEIYGTLLHIDGGHLHHIHPQQLRVQIALEKTIAEFNMWNSMSRKPGQPWEYMLRQYQTMVEEAGMVSTRRKGDVPEIDARKVWGKILDRLVKNEYVWDEGKYGDLESLAAKVAYFYHASLQGSAASPQALETLSRLTGSGIRCGLLADAQIFTVPQLLRDLARQGPLQSVDEALAPSLFLLSYQAGLRKPSPSLYSEMAALIKQQGLQPDQVLHVSHRLQDDLAAAKKAGFHTALYAADRNHCRVTAADLKTPEWKPDRLITDLRQILQILTI